MKKTIICKYDKLPSERYRDVFRKNNLEFSNESKDWDVYFPKTDKLKLIELASLEKVSNKYLGLITGTDCLISRTGVWTNLVDSYGREEASRIMPETYVLDDKKDIRRLKSDKRVHYILKNSQHRRLGLLLADSVENVIKEKENFDIAQPLITNLLRYKGTSFNFRVYALLKLHNDVLTCYLYHEGVCIYGKPPECGIELFDRMITHSRNKVPEEFPELMSEFLEEMNISYQDFFSKISMKLRRLLDSSVHEFGKLDNLKEAKCFQVFGVDILLNQDNNPIICEVNKGPSMKSRNENHADMKNEMIEEMLSVVGLREKKNEGFVECSSWKIIT